VLTLLLHSFPFEDPVVVIKCTGQAILSALENSVCLYPALEGRFPQVSNIEFTFDQSKPPNSRIVVKSVTVAGAPLDLTRIYKLATRGYMGRGKDGFTSLLVQSEGGDAEEIVNEENGVLISTILRQYFMSLKVIGRWKNWGKNMERHWNSVHEKMQSCSPVVESKNSAGFASGAVEVARRALAKTKVDPSKGDTPVSSDTESDYDTESEDSRSASAQQEASTQHEAATNSVLLLDENDVRLHVVRKVIRKWRLLAGLEGESAACDSIDEADFHTKWTKAIAPKLENRIQMIGDKQEKSSD
jgi:5'-nucleotidase